ncbi:hypothetical protein GN958_ATG12746 [Phytophthora infestans]|uniref:Uncharacterized protein n=1 Tax=Phytophthora infestans TaxID=4787 RepID=A0A8S9UFE2_PHYIN|nr:hypothetical protein GN958_ATG12746 [Phytophthora infestans]
MSRDRARIIGRFNQVPAVFKVLDIHLESLRTGEEIATICRAFGHVYNALVSGEYLEWIPFFEKMLEVYDAVFLTPSRFATVHGVYDPTYQCGDLKKLNLREVSSTWSLLTLLPT